jgi:hypothetical protein
LTVRGYRSCAALAMTVVTILRTAPTELAMTGGDWETDVQVEVDMERPVGHDTSQEVRHHAGGVAREVETR